MQPLMQTLRISTFSQNEPDFKRQEEILEKVARELKLYTCNHFKQTVYCLTDSLTLEQHTHVRNKYNRCSPVYLYDLGFCCPELSTKQDVSVLLEYSVWWVLQGAVFILTTYLHANSV